MFSFRIVNFCRACHFNYEWHNEMQFSNTSSLVTKYTRLKEFSPCGTPNQNPLESLSVTINKMHEREGTWISKSEEASASKRSSESCSSRYSFSSSNSIYIYAKSYLLMADYVTTVSVYYIRMLEIHLCAHMGKQE